MGSKKSSFIYPRVLKTYYLFLKNNTEIIKGGTRKHMPNILMMPFKVVHNLIKYGKILPSIFWDFFGFAEFILIKKK
jgi:hypothetical protein